MVLDGKLYETYEKRVLLGNVLQKLNDISYFSIYFGRLVHYQEYRLIL